MKQTTITIDSHYGLTTSMQDELLHHIKTTIDVYDKVLQGAIDNEVKHPTKITVIPNVYIPDTNPQQ